MQFIKLGTYLKITITVEETICLCDKLELFFTKNAMFFGFSEIGGSAISQYNLYIALNRNMVQWLNILVRSVSLYQRYFPNCRIKLMSVESNSKIIVIAWRKQMKMVRKGFTYISKNSSDCKTVMLKAKKKS